MTPLGMFKWSNLNSSQAKSGCLINWLVNSFLWCLCNIFACFRTCEPWHDDYFVYKLHVPYNILILIIKCVHIYLLMFVYICFVWLCAVWLPFFYMMHVWLLCLFEILTYWFYRLILLPILAFWFFFLHDYFIHLDTCILVVIYLVHLDMLILFVIYYLDYPWECYSYHLYYFLLSLWVKYGWYTCSFYDCLLHNYFFLYDTYYLFV